MSGGGDPDLELHLAIAIYFATNAASNLSVRQYYNRKQDTDLQAFISKIFADDAGYDIAYRTEMDEGGVDRYRSDMRRIVGGDTRLQVRMLGIRKFFSVPWLVCVDAFLGSLE